uniref:BING4 C-terminal domain-containing protein n=1 Tax=Setaria digitata TaxID=48799 RepID=A0A915PTJ0_9BILA
MMVKNETKTEIVDLSHTGSVLASLTKAKKRPYQKKVRPAYEKNGKKSSGGRYFSIPGDALKRHDTGAANINPANVKTNFHKAKLATVKKRFLERTREVARAEILNNEKEGFLAGDEGELTYTIKQKDICSDVDIASASKHFDLWLERFGPYRADYIRNGRHLLIGGKRGHVAAFDWLTKTLRCEMNVMEGVRDVKWLHVETMFAVAQKRWTRIYDNTGVELHCLKNLHDIRRLEFLPRHFLLVAGSNTSFLHYLDVSMGKVVQSFPTKQGPLDVMTQNPNNAIIHTGHGNGTVQLWSPNVREALIKMLAHPCSVRGISVEGNYMATTGLDQKLRIWDVRNYKQLYAYTLPFGLAEVSFSQRYAVACSVGNQVQILNDAHLGTTTAPYMSHQCSGIISSLRFCPYEDVLGVGHQHGFTSLLVPGSGEPNFNALLTNPYESKTQRREREVKQLLDKIQPELITLNTKEIVEVNTDLLEKENERLKLLLYMTPREVKFKPRNKKKGRGSSLKKEQIKQGMQSEQRFAMNEERKKLEEELLKKEAVKTENSPKTVLDRGFIFLNHITNPLFWAKNVVVGMAFNNDERADFKLPKDLEQAKRLGLVLSKYKDKHYYTVLFGISTVYIMLQSLAIPGSIFLTVLSGYLFSFPIALCLVCTCSACGAQICYFFALLFGRERIMALAPEKISKWRNEISDFDSLFYFIIFLRITPVLPNWLINLASPIFDVPISAFFFGTFLGVAPPSCIYIQAGATLQRLTHMGAAWSWSAILLVAFTAFLSLTPIFYKRLSNGSGISNKLAKNIKSS